MLLYALVPPPSRGPVWNEWRCNSAPKPLPRIPAESIRLKNNNASVAIATCHSSIIAFHYIVLCEPLVSMIIIAESTFGWCVLMRGRSCIMFMDRHWVEKAMWVCESSSGASDGTASGPYWVLRHSEFICFMVNCALHTIARLSCAYGAVMYDDSSYSDVMRDGGRWVKVQHWCVTVSSVAHTCIEKTKSTRFTWFLHFCIQMYSRK